MCRCSRILQAAVFLILLLFLFFLFFLVFLFFPFFLVLVLVHVLFFFLLLFLFLFFFLFLFLFRTCCCLAPTTLHGVPKPSLIDFLNVGNKAWGYLVGPTTVSYTHLTLPTICSV